MKRTASVAGLLCSAAMLASPLLAQLNGNCSPVMWTREQDHADMLQQLGIQALRPGPSGRAEAGAPNAANYDPALANPYPDLPDPLTMKDGRKVTTAKMWQEERRAEIVEDFEREVLGRVPANVPAVRWEVKETVEHALGGVPIVSKHLVGRVDNSACPEISVEIDMALVVPKNAKGKVPVLMMFGRPYIPRPGEEAPPQRGGPHAVRRRRSSWLQPVGAM